jgi:predicted metalloprotease
MRWDDQRESTNVEDRRGRGGIGGLSGGALVVIVVVVAAYALFTGKDPRELIGVLTQVAGEAQQSDTPTGTPKDKEGKFAAAVLASTEDVWSAKFKAQGLTYEPPTLVLYDQATVTACGFGQAAMGPFYCPNDRRVYLDLTFFKELETRFGASGDFARAYVIAHEVGHHVQNLEGKTALISQAEQQAPDKVHANAISVRTELQADCYAGVWAKAYAATGRMQAGDIDNALSAAAAVGDDTIEKKTRGEVVPDSFTHGSAAQRTMWFKTGYRSGDPTACDTFKGMGVDVIRTQPEGGRGSGDDTGGPTD